MGRAAFVFHCRKPRGSEKNLISRKKNLGHVPIPLMCQSKLTCLKTRVIDTETGGAPRESDPETHSWTQNSENFHKRKQKSIFDQLLSKLLKLVFWIVKLYPDIWFHMILVSELIKSTQKGTRHLKIWTNYLPIATWKKQIKNINWIQFTSICLTFPLHF